jgi:hypothetical protein
MTSFSKTSGVTLVWTPDGVSSGGSVLITLKDLDVTKSISVAVADNGSYTIPSADLVNFSVGERLEISIGRAIGNSETESISGVDKALLVAGISYQFETYQLTP